MARSRNGWKRSAMTNTKANVKESDHVGKRFIRVGDIRSEQIAAP